VATAEVVMTRQRMRRSKLKSFASRLPRDKPQIDSKNMGGVPERFLSCGVFLALNETIWLKAKSNDAECSGIV
jgi:hypothetical protein